MAYLGSCLNVEVQKLYANKPYIAERITACNLGIHPRRMPLSNVTRDFKDRVQITLYFGTPSSIGISSTWRAREQIHLQ